MRLILTSALLAFALPASASPLAEALSAPAGQQLYAYDMTYETPEISAEGSIDPAQPRGSRVTVTSPAEDTWPKDFTKGVAAIDKHADRDMWCHQFAEMIPADADLLSETETTVTYTFQPVPDPDEEDDAKFAKYLRGEVTIDKSAPAILRFQLKAPKPFKPMVIAKVKQFEMTASCARAPDGRTYVEQFEMNVSGSAMMQKFEERVARTISNLRPTAG